MRTVSKGVKVTHDFQKDGRLYGDAMFRTFLAVCGEHVWPYERTYVLRHRVVSKNSRRPLFLQLPIRLWSRQSQFGQLCACSGTKVPRLVKTAAHRGYSHYICLFLAR